MMVKKNRKFYKKKRYIIPFGILLIVLLFNVVSPILVKNYINEELANIEGYNGQVGHIDMSIFKGSYVIEDMFLNKTDAKSQIPFLKFPKIYFSLELRSFFKGQLVSEIVLVNPEIIYLFEDHQYEKEKIIKVVDLTTQLINVVPITINHFEIVNGKLAFVELSTDPNIDLQINDLDLVAANFGIQSSKNGRFNSTIDASGISIGQGKLSLNSKFDTAKSPPDMDIFFSLENSDLTAFNDFSRHYTGVDFSSGTFSLYSEIAVADGYLNGYMKPLIIDSKLIGKGDRFHEVLWEGFVGLFKEIFKNHRTNTIAMKIPVKGDIGKIKTKKISTVISIFENAWIKAFTGKVDKEIENKGAIKEKKKSKD